MPCYTDKPLRDVCNHETSKILRAKFAEAFPDGRVVWVEYEEPVRAIKGWEDIILLHPKPEGYAVIAEITAKTISEALQKDFYQEPVRPENSGVQVINLMGNDNTSVCPVIAGWYSLSFKVDSVNGENPLVRLHGKDATFETPLSLEIKVKSSAERTCKRFFTEAEGYGYTRDYLVLEAQDCTISEILLEKMRPSRQASVYNTGSYIDTVSPFSNGELLEFKN